MDLKVSKDDGKKSTKTPITIKATVAVISVLIAGLMISAYKSGFGMKSESNGAKFYDSIDELISDTSFPLTIPSYISNQQELTIGSILGQLVEISNDEVLLHASVWVDDLADPLGIYGADKESLQEYVVEHSNNADIHYVNTKSLHDGNDTYTLIHWCSYETSYGLKIRGELSAEEAFNLIEVPYSKASLLSNDDRRGLKERGGQSGQSEQLAGASEDSTEHTEEADGSEDKSDDGSFLVEGVWYRYRVYLPKNKVSIQTNEQADLYYLNDKLILVVAYDGNDIYKEAYYKNSDVQTRVFDEDGITFIFITENPFDGDGTADFENFINNVDRMKDSVETWSIGEKDGQGEDYR